MSTRPCTAAQLATVAAREPGRLAVHDADGPCSYGEFHHRVLRCAQILAGAGVRAGDGVAVSGPGLARQLVVLLAAEGLGAATASFGAEGDRDAQALFSHVQWVVSGRAQDVPPTLGFLLADDAFWAAVAEPLQAPPVPWSEPASQAPRRFGRTSGSTGAARFVVQSQGGQEWWIDGVQQRDGCVPDARTRLLLLAPLVVGGALPRAAACLRRGAAVLGGEQLDLGVLRPTTLYGLPVHLEGFLAALPPGTRMDPPIGAAVIGGPAPRLLRERTTAILGTPLRNGYGCNEVGPVTHRIDDSGEGELCEGMEVRILGEDGSDLPPGAEGTIALRSPALVQGYLGQPVATAKAFHDGWFVTSDIGTLVAPRRLRLLGRRDDVLSIGGLKIASAVLEDRLARLPCIAAAAVLSVQLDGGRTTLGVAAVLAPGRGVEEARAELATALADVLSMGIRLVVLEALPRLPGGKLDRPALLQRFLAEVRRR